MPQFRIDEEGAIRLLKKDIYSRDDVFMRELLQNAFDSGANLISFSLLHENSYLFNWDEIPGNDNVRLLEFLEQNFIVDWVKTATIEKINDTIKVYAEKNLLSLRLNHEKTKVFVKIDDGRTEEFIVMEENGMPKIYEDSKVWGLYCCDNGSGMTEKEITDGFLCLCKSNLKTDNPVYRRFGIGVFTYLAFAKEIEICTKTTKENGLYSKILSPERIETLADIKIDDFKVVEGLPEGTGILLRLRSQTSFSHIIKSLKWYIRFELPAELIVNACNIRSNEFVSTIAFSKEKSSYNFTTINFENYDESKAGYKIAVKDKIKGGYITTGPLSSSKIILCEDGILIDEDSSDLIPDNLRSINFFGLINVERGWLDIDAARLKTRRSDKYFQLKELTQTDFYESLYIFIKQNTFHANNWGSKEIFLYSLIKSLSDREATRLLTKFNHNIFFDVVNTNERFSLKQLGDLSKQNIIYCLEGDGWGWEENIGNLGGYTLKLFIDNNRYARIAHSKGTLVFILPKTQNEGCFISMEKLKKYFDHFGINLYEITNVNQGKPFESKFPSIWKEKFNLPSNMSNAQLPTGIEIFIDKNKNVTVDIQKEILKDVDAKLREGYIFEIEETKIIEGYLQLLSGNFNTGMGKIKEIILDLISRKQRSPTFLSLMEDIKNGR